MEKYAAIDRAAKLSIIFSAVYIVGALIINLAPLRIVQLTVPVDLHDVTATIPVSVYILSVYFSLNILAAVLVMKRRGIYAPLFPIAAYIAVLSENKLLAGAGVKEFVYNTQLYSFDSYISFLCFGGAAICTAVSAAKAASLSDEIMKGIESNEV